MEMAIAITCSSMPHLVPIFRRQKIRLPSSLSLRNLLRRHTRQSKSTGDTLASPVLELKRLNSSSTEQDTYLQTQLLGTRQGYGILH